MTDRELLELAAKACGMTGMGYAGPRLGLVKLIDPTRPADTGSFGPNWNPLTDDGDALRLAVKLAIDIRLFYSVGWKPDDREYCVGTLVDRMGWGWDEPIGDDRYAATRRAIVRAAAEIGKAMQ